MTANLLSEVFSPFRWIRALQRLKHKITWTTHPLKHGKWCNQIRRELKHNNNNKKWNHSVLWIPHNYLPLLKGTVHPKMSNPVIIYSWCSKPVYGTQNKIEKSLVCACVYESNCGPMLFLLWLYREKRKKDDSSLGELHLQQFSSTFLLLCSIVHIRTKSYVSIYNVCLYKPRLEWTLSMILYNFLQSM